MNACILALFLLVISSLPAMAAPDAFAPAAKRLTETIKREMAANKVKGLSIALVDDQRVIWSRAFGYADEAAKVPATVDTVYRAGSISKVLTSMRAMQLSESGRLDIDADVRRVLPDFSVHSRFENAPITARMLMTHHSGLPTDVVAGMWTETPDTLAQFVPKIARESLASPPATEFRYSNVAYSLLGRMIEVLDGKEFARSMQDGLLGPLGMNDSSYVMTAKLWPRYAKGYQGGREADRPTLRDQPTGALFTTVTDMSRFLSALFAQGRGVVSPDTLREMTRVQFPGLPLDFGHEMGLGWMLSGVRLKGGQLLVWHGGAAIPFQAFCAMLPGEKLGVVILSNTQEASHFLSTLGIEALDLALEARTGIKPTPAPEPAKPQPVSVKEAELARVVGAYATFSSLLGAVWQDAQGLKMWLWERAVELEPVQAGPGRMMFLPRTEALFGLGTKAMPDLSLEFTQTAGREVLVLRGHATPYAFEKIVPRPIPQAWKDRLGVYVTDQTGRGISYRSLELLEQDGLLLAKIGVSNGIPGSPTAQSLFPLVLVSDREAVIGGIGTGSGGVVRAENGGLYHSGYDFRRVAR
ncbi:MAG: serine hydrolase domain-containing protein [Acidobacteriota bacterium]